MKVSSVLAVLLTAAIAALSIGCGTLNARVGKEPAPAGVDQATVEMLVCHGVDAGRYITERGGADADVIEREARAVSEIQAGQRKGDPKYGDCCQQAACPNSPIALAAAAAAKATPTPSPSPSPDPVH
jgi:hypothetical protein